MSDKTKIEWTDATWNPVTGCTKVSPGCDNCYAERVTERFHGKGSFANVTLHPDRLDQPLRWRRPRKVFVNSMSDLFHDDVPDEYIAKVFAVMALASQHTFQILTKRHGRMRSLLSSDAFREEWEIPTWPLPNVWLGVSVEDQKWADIRIPALLETPAAVRFLSCEPLLGPVDLKRISYYESDCRGCSGLVSPAHEPSCGIEPGEWWRPHGQGLDWVIVGGESGPKARPMHPDWARSLRDQCTAAGVPFLFKQWGEYVTTDQIAHALDADRFDGPGYYRVGKKAGGRELDGRTWDEYPGAS